MNPSVPSQAVLVNALGDSAGVLIFGIFLYLLLQDRAARRLAGSTKSMIAALLALLWNLTSLIVLGLDSQPAARVTVMIAISFSVFSLLPAVLFDLALAGRFRALVPIGYALSLSSIVLHVAEAIGNAPNYHRWGLTLTIFGFGALTVIAAAGVLVSRDGNSRATTSRLVGTMSLFLLAMSFVHFRSTEAGAAWSRELVFHHAAIPLALLILLQDYRFVLLDAFLRFLANVSLAAIFTFGAVEAWQLDLIHRPASAFGQALLLTAACLLLIGFALLRSGLQNLLTRLVFRRPDAEALLKTLKRPISGEDEYLHFAATQLGEFIGADAVLTDSTSEDAEAIVPVRLVSRKPRFILLGRRSGGRRYLSEDLQALERAAGAMAEQVELFRESEMRRLVAQAELRALQSQIHPHFLFNALNTLYGIIPREAQGARETVLNLADIFRYFLNTEKSFLPLEEELRIVRAYLEVERLRLGGKLRVEIDVQPEALAAPIPILSIQPLIENAVKHGIAPKLEGGTVCLHARIEAGGLRVSVSDTGLGFSRQPASGVGLDNVRRRLQLSYGAEATLEIESDGNGSSVSFAIPVAQSSVAEVVS